MGSMMGPGQNDHCTSDSAGSSSDAYFSLEMGSLPPFCFGLVFVFFFFETFFRSRIQTFIFNHVCMFICVRVHFASVGYFLFQNKVFLSF